MTNNLVTILLLMSSLSISLNCGQLAEQGRPNIIIILADDMGINDVSFRGSNLMLTPNIDALAYNGIILDRYYVPNLCTPSRATLLTGKYPIHTGMQHFVIINDEPWGLPLDEKIMPEIFRDAGYSTNLVGKWHLGFAQKDYTPTLRGFDRHFGYYGGYIDYYDHSLVMLDRNYSRGYDFRRNLDITPEGNGTYATDLFTNEAVKIITEHDPSNPLFMILSHLAVHTGNENDPMQAPEEEIAKFAYIKDPKKRIYAAMMSKLDESVGKVMQSLADNDMLQNTIVLFYSDNGAPTVGIHSNGGSNYPLRSQKESPFEGGIRSAGCIWSPLIKQPRRVLDQVMYSADWLPTLAAAAGIPLDNNLHLDGLNMWRSLVEVHRPKPRRIVHTIDDIFRYSTYMSGDYKYINGTRFDGLYDSWLSQPSKEVDPRSGNYAQTVLGSQVSKVLQNPKVTASKIVELRNASQIQCPALDIDADECKPLVAPCVFDIVNDPCERYNLARLDPTKLAELEADIEYFRKTSRPSARIPHADPNADPALHNFTWSWWLPSSEPDAAGPSYQQQVVLLVVFPVVTVSWFVAF